MRIFLTCLLAVSCFGQEESRPVQTADAASASSSTPTATPADEVIPPGGKRVFGVLPNYRTADKSQEGTVIPASRKMYIASKDSFDYPLVGLSAVLAGIGQWDDSHPSFGQGMKGYGHRLITTYADQAVGNLFAEGIYPSLLHEDPRYFRRGTGGFWHRTGYAVSRVIITQKDGGGSRFNYSEWLGNATATAISNAYYPDGRTAMDNSTKLVEQVGIDALSQVLKEFWPDIRQKFFHKKNQ